jgi:hypothetical protein
MEFPVKVFKDVDMRIFSKHNKNYDEEINKFIKENNIKTEDIVLVRCRKENQYQYAYFNAHSSEIKVNLLQFKNLDDVVSELYPVKMEVHE